MTMDISNQNKLSEFYEELNRLNVEVVRPDINECFADFRTIDGKFYYAASTYDKAYAINGNCSIF